ncbi:MAG TPA: hypothetical protein VEY30_05770 [Myxococcaceae bacterium]|nr:hypothetical protein [Myxococcaceae bacterium]
MSTFRMNVCSAFALFRLLRERVCRRSYKAKVVQVFRFTEADQCEFKRFCHLFFGMAQKNQLTHLLLPA